MELFGAYFERIGLDPVNKRAVPVEVNQAQEESKGSTNPQQAFQEELAKSERGKEYK